MELNVFRSMSYGVYITTSYYGGRAAGCVTNSNTQITSSPATVSVSVNHDNYTNKCIRESGKFAFTILSEESDPALIGHFGFQSSKDVHKLEKLEVPVKWINGVPAIETGCGYVVCEVIGTMETETHTIFLGKVIEAKVLSKETPMTYRYYHEVIRGKSPKNAPTYIPEEKKEAEKPAGNLHHYACQVCGYIYEGESLPEDFVCPICKHGVQDFEQID